jgi:hypothetical protein
MPSRSAWLSLADQPQLLLLNPAPTRQEWSMTMLSDSIREALTAGHLAHLVTINPDGSPHVTIVWIGLEGDEIVSGRAVNVTGIESWSCHLVDRERRGSWRSRCPLKETARQHCGA